MDRAANVQLAQAAQGIGAAATVEAADSGAVVARNHQQVAVVLAIVFIPDLPALDREV